MPAKSAGVKSNGYTRTLRRIGECLHCFNLVLYAGAGAVAGSVGDVLGTYLITEAVTPTVF